MTNPMITVIGTGNMGHSLMTGLIHSGHPAEKIIAADPDSEKRSELQSAFAIQTTADNKEAIRHADVVIFAIKPAVFAELAPELRDILVKRRPLILSIAAGVRLSNLEQAFGSELSIVRAMPNTPAMIGAGATALFANSFVTNHERNQAEAIMRAVGIVVWLENEAQMDTVTALSGSGPAYFFLFMESLQTAAIDLGLPHEVARLLTLQTALGAARMASESKASLSTLREQVTSKGGTTEKALQVFSEHHLSDIVKHALTAAKSRSEALANLLGEKS